MTITTEITVVGTAERITITTGEGQLRGPPGPTPNLTPITDKLAELDLTNLIAWVTVLNFTLLKGDERDVNGALIRADVRWPDKVLGEFIADTLSTSFPGAVDAWHVTYLSTPPLTITQPAYTRNAMGAVVIQPDLIITEGVA
jgi:hypothetical protein